MQIVHKESSKIDNVTKYILEDDKFGKNEVSFIVKGDKTIICLPTQTNCKMGCTFCHLTGTTRPSKNLSQRFMAMAVYAVLKEEGITYDSNPPKDLLISYMGAGEPLLNWEEVVGSIAAIHQVYPKIARFAISTMMPSTKAMEDFTNWVSCRGQYKIKLHLSVHGIASRKEIIKSGVHVDTALFLMKEYLKYTRNPIEYHYTLVEGVNDSREELIDFSQRIKGFSQKIIGVPATVKFLTLSEHNGCITSGISHEELVKMFPRHTVEFYDPPGRDVGASCGMFDQSLYNETT